MYETIPQNSATASKRRIYFQLVDATDLKTPEDISVTGVKVSLSFNGGAFANSTNDIVKIGAGLDYYIELTQAESNTAVGSVRGRLQPTGCALEIIQATIVADDIFVASPTVTDIADAILKRDWSAVSGESARSMLNALRFLRNKWSIAAGVLTVTKEDDSTAAWTAALTGAQTGVTAVDPS